MIVVQFSTMGLIINVTVALCCNDPLVPVMVSVLVLAGIVFVVVIVNVEEPEPLTEVGLKLPLAPVGKPLTLHVTVPLKPLVAVAVAVQVALLPAVTVWDDGVAETEKSGAGLTTKVTVVLCTKLPLVPVIVSVFVPAGVVVEVVTVNVEEPEPVTVAGLKLPLAPVGKPLTLHVTVPLNPLIALAVDV